MRNLVNEVCKRDRGQRKSREEMMTSGREEPRSGVPGQQDCDAGKRDGAEDGRNQSLASAKTRVHRFRFPQRDAKVLSRRRSNPREPMLTIGSFRIHKDVTTALNKISIRGTHRPGSVETVPSMTAE